MDKYVQELIYDLSHNESSIVRGHAATALGKLKAGEAIPALIRGLKNDPSHYVRQLCADTLVKLNATDAIPVLIHALEHDKNWNVRFEAAIALGELGTEDVIPIVLDMLCKGDSELGPQIYNVLLRSLEKLGISMECLALSGFCPV